MSIFNSLGSNYDFQFVFKALFATGQDSQLTSFLEDKYQGKATLLYKGRQALELALKLAKLPEDSCVAINGFTCFAVYEAIKKVRLNAEYLDIEKGDLNFSAETLEKAIKDNPSIKAVIIQNTLGYPCEIENISKICKEKNLILIEDLAHSIGTKYSNGKEARAVGGFVVLSFSQDKMIDGISGGALISKASPEESFYQITLSKQIRDRFYPLFTYLIRTTYSFGLGKILHFILKKLKLLSGPMDGGESIHLLPVWYHSLIESQFKNLNENLNHRKAIASIYAKLINPKFLSPKITEQISLSTNLRFPIFVKNRQSLINFLAENQIFISDIWYDAPIAPKKYLAQTDYSGQCPNAELASEEILNLPTHINVSEKDADRISNLINQWLKSK